jgi:hypothetical protein
MGTSSTNGMMGLSSVSDAYRIKMTLDSILNTLTLHALRHTLRQREHFARYKSLTCGSDTYSYTWKA